MRCSRALALTTRMSCSSSEVLCALHISESADGAAPLIEAHVPDTSDALPQHAVLVNVSPLVRHVHTFSSAPH